MKIKTFLIWLEDQKSILRSFDSLNEAEALQEFCVRAQLQSTALSQSKTTTEASHQLLLWSCKREDSFP